MPFPRRLFQIGVGFVTCEKDLFDRAREKWGLPAQINMLAEESAELAVASLHMNRAIKDKSESMHNFAEEIADVEFMISEMKHYYPTLEQLVAVYRSIKRDRLKTLLGASP